MVLFGQITTNVTSPVSHVVMLAAGAIERFVAVKIGGFSLKMLSGLAVLGDVVWLFLQK